LNRYPAAELTIALVIDWLVVSLSKDASTCSSEDVARSDLAALMAGPRQVQF